MRSRGAAAPLAAYVLHQYDWSESSLIVDLFTRDAGRVVVAAKGAKRPTSQLRAVLMPFQRIAVSFARTARDESASEVHNLRGAEWAGGPALCGGDALLAGFYLNELLLKLLARDDPHPALWDAYAATLPWLGGADEAAALRAFELVLLAETGHLPDLTRITATLAPVDTTRRYSCGPRRVWWRRRRRPTPRLQAATARLCRRPSRCATSTRCAPPAGPASRPCGASSGSGLRTIWAAPRCAPVSWCASCRP